MSSNQKGFELKYFSDNHPKDKIISENTSVEDITKTIKAIDWNTFSHLILSKNENEWIYVGGDLENAGLACTYEERGEEFVIDEAPESIEQLEEILISYLNGDGKFKTENKFVGEKEEKRLKVATKKKYEEWKRNFVVQERKERLNRKRIL